MGLATGGRAQQAVCARSSVCGGGAAASSSALLRCISSRRTISSKTSSSRASTCASNSVHNSSSSARRTAPTAVTRSARRDGLSAPSPTAALLEESLEHRAELCDSGLPDPDMCLIPEAEEEPPPHVPVRE